MFLSDILSDIYEYQGWDNMFWRKKNNEFSGDFTTSRLLDSGLYNVNEPSFYEKKSIFNPRERPIIVGMWYVFVLSCLLWWLPLFGPMIAGYIGGRKAGSPSKGIMVAVIPVIIIFFLLMGMDAGLLPFLTGLVAVPQMIASGIQSISPSAASYLSGMYNSLGGAVGITGNGFFIVVVFGYIGGMMAAINRSEIASATGSPHFTENFKNMFSGVGLGKLADLVAERVVWGLGTVSYAGRNLIDRSQSEPDTFSFDNLKRLPAASDHSSYYPNERQGVSYHPQQAFGYEDMQPVPPAYEDNNYQDDLVSWDAPERFEQNKQRYEPQDEEWGISHRDLSEDSMIDSWKEHDRNMDSGGRKRPNKRKSNESTHKPRPRKKSSKPARKQKRDALVIDDDDEPEEKEQNKKKPRTYQKRKQPSLVSRALVQDEEIKTRKEKEKDPLASLMMDDEEITRPKRSKPVQAYDRL
jgi:hypothetical protein